MVRNHISSLLLLSVIYANPIFGAEEQRPEQERLDKGLTVDFWAGGWEPDYTKTAYETMLSYRGVDRIHLLGGFGDSHQVYYDRSKVFAGAYYFYDDYSYVRTSVSRREYKYPVAAGMTAPNPDSSSYHQVPRIELEVSHFFDKDLRTTLTYELSRPNFYHDRATTISVKKLSGEVAFGVGNPKLHPKVMVGVLRDPDPNVTEIKGVDNLSTPQGVATATNVVFRTSNLVGGALKYAEDNWSFETKYLQNRDLDNSYDYSLLNTLVSRLDTESSLQLDYVYDKFSNKSNLAGQTAAVYMVSYYQQYTPSIRLGIGAKHIGVPNRGQNTGFVYIQAKSGLMW
jgi:hypothetical protein